MSQGKIKEILIGYLGKQKYTKLASSIGGFVVSKKLKNPNYKKRFCEKLSRSVSLSIRQRMKYPDYYKTWAEKSKSASPKGVQKIRYLLDNDKEFRARWIKNCRKGGEKIYKNKMGVHDPKFLENRMRSSLKGLRRTGRNQKGPLGEKMYNRLEKSVASILLKHNLFYTYEKLFRSNNANGYISCDFISELDNKKLFIETTCWDSPEEKAKELNKKFKIFKENEPDIICCVVTTNHTLKDKYEKFLDKDLIIFNVKEFDFWLNKNVNSASGGWSSI